MEDQIVQAFVPRKEHAWGLARCPSESVTGKTGALVCSSTWSATGVVTSSTLETSSASPQSMSHQRMSMTIIRTYCRQVQRSVSRDGKYTPRTMLTLRPHGRAVGLGRNQKAFKRASCLACVVTVLAEEAQSHLASTATGSHF